MATDDRKRGTCRWCGNKTQIYINNKLCEGCDSNVIHCSICDDDYDDSDHCRHVFQDQNFEWSGSGAWSNNDVKASFLQLLEKMPAGFAVDLKKAIRSKRFHTWLIAPLIGSGGLLELHGMPNRDGKFMPHAWGDHLLKIGQGDDAEETADGYHWLASLYNDKTPGANQTTIKWINEFLRKAAVAA